jgi:hypothetical protein
MAKNQAKRPIFGNPWVYLEASYQADRTYTSIVRAFRKRYPDLPYLPQLAGMWPIALMSAVRRVDGFHAGAVEIDLEEIADRHFGRGETDPLDLAMEVIEFWKGRDPLGSGFKLDLDPETGIAMINWPAFASRYDKEVRFSKLQSERASKPRKKATPAAEAAAEPTNGPEPNPQADQNGDRPTSGEINGLVNRLSTGNGARKKATGKPRQPAAEPRLNHSLSNKLSSDLKGDKNRHKKSKIRIPPEEVERRRRIPQGKKPYPEDPEGPVVDNNRIVWFLNFAEYQAIATATPGLVPNGLVGIEEVRT